MAVLQQAIVALAQTAVLLQERKQFWLPLESTQQSYPLPQVTDPLQPSQAAPLLALQTMVFVDTTSFCAKGEQAGVAVKGVQSAGAAHLQ